MTASDPIDRGLIRQASIAGALLIANYIAWALGAPVGIAIVCESLSLVSIAYFLVQRPCSDNLPVKLFIVACALLALGSPTLGWDTRSIWMLHAKRIYFDSSLYSQFDNYAPWSSNDYPDFVPALSATLAHMLRHWSESALKVTNLLALFPALLIAAAYLKTQARQLLFLMALAFVAGDQVFNGYMDWLIAAYVCAGALLLFSLIDVGTPEVSKGSTAAAALVVFVVLTLTKNEGTATLAAMLVAAGVLAMGRSCLKFNRLALAVVVLSLIPIMAWKIGCFEYGVRSELVSSGLFSRAAERAALPSNWLQILGALTLRKEFLVPLAAASIFAIGFKRDVHFQFLLSIAAIYFAALIFVYLSTPRELGWHLGSSADRTMMPVELLLAFAVISAGALCERTKTGRPWIAASDSQTAMLAPH